MHTLLLGACQTPKTYFFFKNRAMKHISYILGEKNLHFLDSFTPRPLSQVKKIILKYICNIYIVLGFT